MVDEKARIQNSTEGGEPDPAVDHNRGHRRLKTNAISVLSCIGKRTKEGCDRGSEDGQITQTRRERVSSSAEIEESGNGRFVRKVSFRILTVSGVS